MSLRTSSLAVAAFVATTSIAWAASPAPSIPLDPTDRSSVLAHLRTSPPLALHKGEYADAVVRAHRIVQEFAREHGWTRQTSVRTFDSAEIFADQAALWRRILELNKLPLNQPLPTKGLAAGIEGRVLVALDPRGYARVAPEYAREPNSWVRLLAHEMVHRLHVVILNGNEDAMGPQWFFEGFAVLGAGQTIDEGLTYRSDREAFDGVRDAKSPLLYRRFVAAVRYFSGRVPLAELVEKAGSKDFEGWLAGK